MLRLMLCPLLIAGLLSVDPSAGWADAPPARTAALDFERLEGLSHNTVLALLQDRRGYLWIGTLDGLNRYDGYDVTVYRHTPGDSASLPGNQIRQLIEDDRGRLWIGTNRGVARWDPSTDTFVRHELGGDEPEDVFSMAWSPAQQLWVLTYAQRLYRFDPVRERFEEPLRPSALPAAGDSVVFGHMIPGPDAEFLITSQRLNGTVTLYAVAKPTPSDSLPLPGRYRWGASGGIPPMAWDGSETLWVGAAPPAAETPPFAFVPGLPPDEPVQALSVSRRGAVWVGVEDGLYRYDPAAETLRHHRPEDSPTAWLNNNVQCLLEDAAGALWVGTLSGLYRHDPHRKPFVHWGAGTGLPEDPGAHTIMAIHEDASGHLWLGTLGGGLLQMDAMGTRGAAYRHRPQQSTDLPNDIVWAIHEADERLWLGTEPVCALDPRTARCTFFPIKSPVIEEDRTGHLWFAERDTLVRLDPRTGRIERRATGLDLMQSLYAPPEGPAVLWIGGERGELARLLPDGSITVYPRGGAASGLQPGTIWAIHPGADGTLWLGTRQGLVHFDPVTETFQHVADAAARPGAIIYSILEDNAGRLWMGSSQGLVRFDPQTMTFRYYDAADGIGSVEFNRRAAFRGRDGSLYFGGLNGLTRFDPRAIRDNPYVPPVVITRITVSGRDTTVERSPHSGSPLTLTPTDKALAIEFAALSFTNPQKNRYAYRLDGFDERWVHAGTRRRAQYTNLPAGDYVFRVKGANSDGVWNDAGTRLRLTVLPPIWKTWWFRIGVLAVLLGVGVGLYRARVAYLLRMERLRLRIASDLHDDIGSKLGGVALLSDMLRARTPSASAADAELRRISTLTRETAATLRDIVWFVDPEHDAPEALLWKMKNEAATLLNGVAHRFEHPPPEELAGLAALDVKRRRNLFLIYKEALHNIARHAAADTATITLRRRRRNLELTIADDGAGFDAATDTRTRGGGYGLVSMQRRAEQMDAQLDVTSRPGDGTRIRLRLEIT